MPVSINNRGGKVVLMDKNHPFQQRGGIQQPVCEICLERILHQEHPKHLFFVSLKSHQLLCIMQTTNAPLWLDIKTEYIDANLDKVIQYLAKESYNQKNTDSFYEETLRLLTMRVQEIIEARTSSDIAVEETDGERYSTVTALRILGSWLLIREDRTSPLYHDAFFVFVMTVIDLLPSSYCEELSELAVKSAVYAGVEALGFSWPDIKDFNPGIVAHKMLRGVRFSQESVPSAWFQGKGALHITDCMIELYECNRDDATLMRSASSLMLMEQLVMVKSAVSERITQSEEDNLEVMHNFTTGLLRAMDKTVPSPNRRLKCYALGDTMAVRFLGCDKAGNLCVETADADHERVSGIIPAKSKAFRNFYSARDVCCHLEVGVYFDAEYKGGNRSEFDIEQSFIKHMIERTIAVGQEVLAELRTINAKGLMCWWTRDGYPAYVSAYDDPGVYAPGDTAYLMIEGVESNGYVYATIQEANEDGLVDEEASKKFCVEGFIDDGYVPAPAPEDRTVSISFIKALCRLLARYQRSLGQASDRFRVLCVCRILAKMAEDGNAFDYLSVACDYLRNLVFFAQGRIDSIHSLVIPKSLIGFPEIARRQDIVSILREYGSTEDSPLLDRIIDSEDPDPLLSHLAKLVQSGNRIREVYPAVNSVIQREIARYLAVETEDHTDLQKVAGPDLGFENCRTEFKTSFFFAPKDAPEQKQEKSIFRVLCSFLNTDEGGILYLGVNNDGVITGIEADLSYLGRRIRDSYKEDIDSYVRYITDRAKVYFDLDVRVHFHIEPAYGNRVIIIRVDPYVNGVVEFEGVPYIRIDNESVKMSQKLRRQITASRLTADNGPSSKIILALQEAIKEKSQARLFRYSSNNGNCRDRDVEPFCLIGGNRFVWCFDLDDGANKLFRISRIGNIRATGKPWTEEDKHRKGDTDIFYLTGDSPVRVQLELDAMARNLILEEFPESSGDLTQIGEGRWLLDTKVFQMYGVGRFFIGLAEHIRIIDAPELEEYVKAYYMRMADTFKDVNFG